ncbi:hypothetical protein ACWD0J_33950 [Streptomyces sp. NPDC003011]
MRIRSALAAAVLAAALTATGAATATAATDGPQHHASADDGRQYKDDDGKHKDDDGRQYKDDDENCSPYFGAIDTETADLKWGGANCYDFF